MARKRDEQAAERRFVSEARGLVLQYLAHQEVPFRVLPPGPDWSLAPYLSIWPVYGRQGRRPGWFAIAGDVPTDYVSAADAPDARAAMRHFARRWLEVAEAMAKGRPHPDVAIGGPEDWPSLHPLLRSRAELLARFAEDDELW